MIVGPPFYRVKLSVLHSDRMAKVFSLSNPRDFELEVKMDDFAQEEEALPQNQACQGQTRVKAIFLFLFTLAYQSLFPNWRSRTCVIPTSSSPKDLPVAIFNKSCVQVILTSTTTPSTPIIVDCKLVYNATYNEVVFASRVASPYPCQLPRGKIISQKTYKLYSSIHMATIVTTMGHNVCVCVCVRMRKRSIYIFLGYM